MTVIGVGTRRHRPDECPVCRQRPDHLCAWRSIRAGSRTVPFVSKAIGVPLAKLAMKVMVGQTLQKSWVLPTAPTPAHLSVKEAVFPFNKFAGVDVLLGPEMKSTGEVMGIDSDFGWAFAKSQAGAGAMLPTTGTAFISVKSEDRAVAFDVARAARARWGFVFTRPAERRPICVSRGWS